MVTKNGTNSRKWGFKYYILCSKPRKGTSLRRTASFGVLCVKIRPGALAVASSGGATPGRARSNALAKKLLPWLAPWLTEIFT